MRCWGMFYGGSNCAAPSVLERADCEEFASIKACRAEFADRLENWSGCYPCTDEKAEMQVFYSDPYMNGRAYPEFRFYVGPRGGIRKERC